MASPGGFVGVHSICCLGNDASSAVFWSRSKDYQGRVITPDLDASFTQINEWRKWIVSGAID